MKKIILLILIASSFFSYGYGFCQEATSSSSATAQSQSIAISGQGGQGGSASSSFTGTFSPSAEVQLELQQKFEGSKVPRPFPSPPVEDFYGPVIPYFGPFGESGNIAVNGFLKTKISSQELESIGEINHVKTKIYLYRKEPPVNECQIISIRPVIREVVREDKKIYQEVLKTSQQIKEELMSSHEIVARIYVQGDHEATSDDVLLKALAESMKLGGTKFLMDRHGGSMEVKSSGFGIGLFYTRAIISDDMRNSGVGGGGTGWSTAIAKVRAKPFILGYVLRPLSLSSSSSEKSSEAKKESQ